MIIRKNIHIIPLLAVLLSLFVTSCTDDAQPTPAESDEVPLVLVVNEEPWENEEVRVTRSKKSMLNGIKGDPRGFGLYCFELGLIDKVVRWNNETSKWNYGYTLLWSIKKSQVINLYAYSPYFWGGYDPMGEGYGSVADKTIEFPCAANNGIDLLWANNKNAQRDDDNKGMLALNFQHALGKLTFGDFINNYGHDIILKSISLSGFYDKGHLSLDNGTWSNQIGTHSIERPSLNVAVENGETQSIGAASLMQIPCDNITVTLTFTSTDFGEETATFTIALEQGVNKTLNITLTNNFEVVIE